MSDFLSESRFLSQQSSQPLPEVAENSTTTDIVPVSSVNTEQFLRLYLAEMAVLLSVKQLAEVLTVAVEQITPIPHMPAWMMGVHNWRGEVLWMIDLGHLCGLTPWYEQAAYGSTYSAVVLQVSLRSAPAKKQTLGMVVSRIGEMEWCDPNVIQSLPLSSITPEIAAFLRGYWWKSDEDILAVLDGEAIFGAMPRQ